MTVVSAAKAKAKGTIAINLRDILNPTWVPTVTIVRIEVANSINQMLSGIRLYIAAVTLFFMLINYFVK